jgi:integrase
MGLYLRGKIYWFTIMQNGKRTQLSTQTDNRKLAERIHAKAITQIHEGVWFDRAKVEKQYTFTDLAERYATWAEGRQRSWQISKKYMVKQLVSRFMNFKLSHFNTNIVEQFQTERLNKGNKPATANRLLAAIKHMFTKACEWEMITEGTFKRVHKVKSLQENNKRLRYLTKEECQSLINACDKHLKPIVIAALNTGMRRGEIFSLNWNNIDLKHGFILLEKTKNGDRREIPINDTLKRTLQGLARRLDIPSVFCDHSTGKRYTDIKHSFNSACRRAGIDDFHFHDLRHTFASHLIMAGVDITTVKELLGHKTLTMTLRYAHLAPSHKVKAVDILDDTLNGKTENCYNFATV